MTTCNLVNHRQCKDEEDDSVGSDWAWHMHYFNCRLPSPYVFFRRSSLKNCPFRMSQSHINSVFVVVCVFSPIVDHSYPYSTVFIGGVTSVLTTTYVPPIFSHDHVPSSKASHYRLLSPYLVHSCVSIS